jgi:hypothetical protein
MNFSKDMQPTPLNIITSRNDAHQMDTIRHKSNSEPQVEV